tara:strand:- start:3145 stop:3747 length:603 start_codon:yes stop_codon:yes gene_type:complete
MHHYFAIHKPLGFLSQFKNNSKRKKRLLQELYDFPDGTMAVGRLDVKSEGLLLLTTDGKWSNELRSSKFEKVYLVEVDGIPTEISIEKIRQGLKISIEGKIHQTKPCKAEKIEKPQFDHIEDRKVRNENHGTSSWLRITLREGKFRQVRKMTAAVGHPTLRLIRVEFAGISLSPLKKGEVRRLNNSELDLINEKINLRKT